ncbi:MAG: tRNA (adenosine(37)-N6)-threonylcarbamoyltransferase complex transferase subunit TsaD [Clostridia bacterium]|nr:tRNA (adenosine(37)-N6)-threonylcarbamoyltransferase complex transferase subunit TsaD [Clostridia bacterium]MBQ3092554.1 tRNA (adenosine(37)-N6)-threonylcarbamoyltransferase complex transferase subunit TsaD [Clostridia bacterium]MBQ9926288.1 tRNA (adenosine(37)-N6)-threonylcarbamoyltransferase complex transferase subunit TsaD [Clostridia bacterium]
MLILALESSCDETAASVSRDGREILSNVVYSQIDMHALYGGVVPEIASRKHAEKITAVAAEAVRQAGIEWSDLDAVAATCAPGLIGALLVGANFAKACSLMLNVPFIPVHHIRGHIAAGYVAFPQLEPPFTALVASGGHTVIIDVEDYTKMTVLGTTRDDAAGEAFDKIGRVLSLPYPGGAALDKLAQTGNKDRYKLPRASVNGHPFDFSFSGLKTAAVNLAHNAKQKGEEIDPNDLAAAVAHAVADSVVPRVVAAAKEMGRKKITAAGGVAANSILRAKLTALCEKEGIELYLPPLSLCGDNGAMIACQAYYEYMAGNTSDSSQNCYANMAVSDQLCGR